MKGTRTVKIAGITFIIPVDSLISRDIDIYPLVLMHRRLSWWSKFKIKLGLKPWWWR